jgi:hypothetical protein
MLAHEHEHERVPAFRGSSIAPSKYPSDIQSDETGTKKDPDEPSGGSGKELFARNLDMGGENKCLMFCDQCSCVSY